MMETLEKKTIGEWQSCGFYKSNELNHVNYDLENVWPKFITIDKSQFTLLFGQSCINLVAAIEHIVKLKGPNEQKIGEKELAKMKNELANNFKIGSKSGKYVLNADVKLADLVMTDQPPTAQGRLEQDKSNYLELVLNDLSNFFKKNAKLGFTQKDFNFVIVEFIQSRSAVNDECKLIFSQVKFVERISLLVDDFLKRKSSFDLELIQALILQLDGVFVDYNKDFKRIGLGLSQEAMTFAHTIAFRKLFDFFTAKLKSEAYVAHDLWVAKRDDVLQFFVSQLVPDQSKDEENAKQFIRKFADSIEQTLSEQMRTYIATKLNERDSEFSRFHFQEKRDASLESMSREDLLGYVLDPIKFILKDLERFRKLTQATFSY